MSVTITDVALLSGVSKATVSAVLNDRPGISQKTRLKVLDVVKKLNYRPNQVARSLSTRATKSIGLVIKEIDNPYFAKVMRGVFDTCTEHGYTVFLGSSELSPEKELQSIETLVSQRVDGLIIAPLQGEGVDFTYLSDLIREKYPLVMLGTVRNYQTNVVEIDNVKGAYLGVSYLISQGHTRIAYFSGPSHSAHSRDRLEGYRRAMIERNIPVRPEYIVQVGSYIENGFKEGMAFYDKIRIPPTSVLCYNDLVAIGLINALLEMGIEVPQNVSVVGFDNIDICDSVKIPLTTVYGSAYQIGQRAAELIIRQISDRSHSLNKRILLDPELVIRKSVSHRGE
jgi:LacI family transcriptional regulator